MTTFDPFYRSITTVYMFFLVLLAFNHTLISHKWCSGVTTDVGLCFLCI